MTYWSRASNEELARAANAGDEAAFEELFHRCERPLYGIFTTRLPADSLADAEELVADTLAALWESLRSTVPDNVQAYLRTIARNKWVAYLKTKKRAVPTEQAGLDDEDLTIDSAYRVAEMRAGMGWFIQLVRDSIESLPARYRPVLFANLRSGAVGEDLATQLKITTQQAAHWRHDALRQLYDAAAVTQMALGATGGQQTPQPCPRFQQLLVKSGWYRGPLGEKVLRTLNRHIAHCGTCAPVKDRLKRGLWLIPVVLPVVAPVGLYELVRDRQGQRDRRPQTTQPPPPPTPEKKKREKAKQTAGIIPLAIVMAAALQIPAVRDAVKDVFQPNRPKILVTLSMWVPPGLPPGGGVRVRSSPGGLDCISTDALRSCHARFPLNSAVRLSAIIPNQLATSGRALVWLGCGNRPTATQPCTVTMTQNLSVCVVAATSPWTLENCRDWAQG